MDHEHLLNHLIFQVLFSVGFNPIFQIEHSLYHLVATHLPLLILLVVSHKVLSWVQSFFIITYMLPLGHIMQKSNWSYLMPGAKPLSWRQISLLSYTQRRYHFSHICKIANEPASHLWTNGWEVWKCSLFYYFVKHFLTFVLKSAI